MSDFEVSAKLMSLDGSTEIFDMSDLDAGYGVIDVTPAEESMERGTSESPFVNGEFENWAKDTAGRYLVALRIKGATWAEVEGRRLALRTAYRSATHYLLVVTLEGVTTTYRARRPDSSSGAIVSEKLLVKSREFVLSFPVQPNPTVTGATP
jgi:hypothetical protein